MFFFFSSRRRHTRFDCDWSSDVCSSDLKDVMCQVEVLVALRLIGLQDVNSIDDWVRQHADPDEAVTVKRSLPSLPIGTGWFWSPGWLGVLDKVKIRLPQTFDSSATPKPGQIRPAAKRMAPI